MSSSSQPNAPKDGGQAKGLADGLEAAVDQAIAVCGGDMRSTIRALIVANEFLEALVEGLRADVSKGYARAYYHGWFKTYRG